MLSIFPCSLLTRSQQVKVLGLRVGALGGLGLGFKGFGVLLLSTGWGSGMPLKLSSWFRAYAFWYLAGNEELQSHGSYDIAFVLRYLVLHQ